jgi:hypothetical protein
MSYTSDNISKTVFPVLDMMMNMQHLGLRALSIYEPLTSAFLDSTVAAQRGIGPCSAARAADHRNFATCATPTRSR